MLFRSNADLCRRNGRKSAATKAAKAGRDYIPPPDDVDFRVVALYAEGLSVRECAERCHISSANAYYKLRAAGVKMRSMSDAVKLAKQSTQPGA